MHRQATQLVEMLCVSPMRWRFGCHNLTAMIRYVGVEVRIYCTSGGMYIPYELWYLGPHPTNNVFIMWEVLL